MTTAVVTLAIGDNYLGRWRLLCERGWRQYCDRHNYTLLVIDKPLDESQRARGRSPAWQKCLVLEPPLASRFDRVIWVDSDIVINPGAPSIDANLSPELIGAIDENTYPTPESRQTIINSLVASWEKANPEISSNWATFRDPAAWHALAGLPKRGRYMVQTGVLVMSPRHHRDLLRHVYDAYEDRGGVQMNYEMRPLSFEIQEHGFQQWIDNRFNALILFLQLYQNVLLRQPLKNTVEQLRFIQSAYATNYFLHFAGCQNLMDLSIQLAKRVF